ncbi:MAG TPA: GspE/PulE family protein [Gemmatimonadaceae bacterium]|nr:GspE/PulE family protein [Gemmatimonadaceae bacterium]
MTRPAVDLREAAAGEWARRLSPRYLDQHCLLPLGTADDRSLLVAAGEAVSQSTLDELELLFERPIRLVEASAAEIRAAILATTRTTEISTDANGDNGAAQGEQSLDDARALAAQAPVVRLVNVLLLDALRASASDVHFESSGPREGVRVRYRLDGVLHDISRITGPEAPAVISRVKIMAGLNIAERRLPQDGRSRVRLAERDIDLRVATLPALHGESVVVRLLDRGAHHRGLDELGMRPAVRTEWETVTARSSGLVLVTGPTGSGKTTTLYAAIGRLNAPGVKIVTVEDPVEYQISGVVQMPVNRKAGLTFASALRSILRHDPDIIMVGETRDGETAAIAVQAALTGHLVFTTLHTNDAPSGVTRLLDMAIEPYLVSATVQAILAQRLVRLLCDNCAELYTPNESALASLGPPSALHAPRANFRRPKGCDECSQTGYRGRVGIYELLVLDDKLRQMIVQRVPLDELRRAARQHGMTPLAESAGLLAAEGKTSIAEVARVIGAGTEA